MRVRELSAFMAKRGVVQARIVEECGVTPATVNQVVKGRGRAEKVEIVIAKKVGIPRDKIFPLER